MPLIPTGGYEHGPLESRGHQVETVCVSPGPADVHFVWEKNGRELETCVPTQTHGLHDGRTHVLSWLRDALQESAEYRCSVLSSAGNKTSRVRVTVMRHGKGARCARPASPASRHCHTAPTPCAYCIATCRVSPRGL